MGLFDKKYCCICGDKIGLLGNRKLEDGDMCKNCAARLSPWFKERKQSTKADIEAQLAYREANWQEVQRFHVTDTFGNNQMVFVDVDAKKIIVSGKRNFADENPDVIDCRQIVDVGMDISEREQELTFRGPDGKQVPYNPPQFSYTYNFNFVIYVDHPFIHEMRFQLCKMVTVSPSQADLRRLQSAHDVQRNSHINAFIQRGMKMDPRKEDDYCRAEDECNALFDLLENLRR